MGGHAAVSQGHRVGRHPGLRQDVEGVVKLTWRGRHMLGTAALWVVMLFAIALYCFTPVIIMLLGGQP